MDFPKKRLKISSINDFFIRSPSNDENILQSIYKVNQSVYIAYSGQLHNTVACAKSQLKRFIHA